MKRKFLLFLIVATVFLGFLLFFLTAKTQACTSDADCLTALNWCCWTEQKTCIRSHTAWPGSPLGTSLTACSSLTDLVKYFYEWAIALGGIAAFVALIIGGYYYLTSMGNAAQLQEAKDRISSAVFGLILLLGSWLLLNTINPELTTLRTPTLGPPVIDVKDLKGFLDKTAEPCAFAAVFPQVNYQGIGYLMQSQEDPSFQHVFKHPQFPEGAKSVRFFQHMGQSLGTNVNTTINPDGTITTSTETILFPEECLSNKVVIYDYDPLTGSPTTTVIKTGNEDTFCDDFSFPLFPTISYKEGGACVFEWSHYDTFLILFGLGCGQKQPSISKSTPNLRIFAEEDRKIECGRVVKYTHN